MNHPPHSTGQLNKRNIHLYRKYCLHPHSRTFSAIQIDNVDLTCGHYYEIGKKGYVFKLNNIELAAHPITHHTSECNTANIICDVYFAPDNYIANSKTPSLLMGYIHNYINERNVLVNLGESKIPIADIIQPIEVDVSKDTIKEKEFRSQRSVSSRSQTDFPSVSIGMLENIDNEFDKDKISSIVNMVRDEEDVSEIVSLKEENVRMQNELKLKKMGVDLLVDKQRKLKEMRMSYMGLNSALRETYKKCQKVLNDKVLLNDKYEQAESEAMKNRELMIYLMNHM